MPLITEIGFDPDQKPSLLLRPPMIQSALASRGKKGLRISDSTQHFLFHTFDQDGHRIRLLGAYDLHRGPSRGLAVLIHGWEGSSESAYVVRLGAQLFRDGMDIFRINLRDHGPTHGLNPGLFNGSLIHETYDVALQSVNLWREMRYRKDEDSVIIAGFSMGGNFAIRIAGSHSISRNKIPGLRHVYAISPAVDPEKTTRMLDAHPILSHYFLRKWFESLKIKEGLFPDLYNFGRLKDAQNVMELTDRVAREHSHYASASHYFQSYTVRPEHMARIVVPLTIMSAQDDPIISPDELSPMADLPLVRMVLTRYGGHNGFFLNGHPAYLDLVRPPAPERSN